MCLTLPEIYSIVSIAQLPVFPERPDNLLSEKSKIKGNELVFLENHRFKKLQFLTFFENQNSTGEIKPKYVKKYVCVVGNRGFWGVLWSNTIHQRNSEHISNNSRACTMCFCRKTKKSSFSWFFSYTTRELVKNGADFGELP